MNVSNPHECYMSRSFHLPYCTFITIMKLLIMQIWSFHNGDLDFGFELRIVATYSLLDGYQLFGENYRLQGCYHLQQYYTSSAQIFP